MYRLLLATTTIREKTISVNSIGPIRVVRSLMYSLLKKSGGGIVVNVSSTTAESAWPFTGAYNMSKAALESATDTIRREAIANNLNLRVCLVIPGPVNTPMASQSPYKAIRWCNENSSSVWEPAMRKSAERSRDAMQRWNLTPSSFRLGYTASEVKLLFTHRTPRVYVNITTRFCGCCGSRIHAHGIGMRLWPVFKIILYIFNFTIYLLILKIDADHAKVTKVSKSHLVQAYHPNSQHDRLYRFGV